MRKRKNQYEKWREKKLPKDVQAEVDGFANADKSADGFERAFRAGWKAYKMLAPTFEKEVGQ